MRDVRQEMNVVAELLVRTEPVVRTEKMRVQTQTNVVTDCRVLPVLAVHHSVIPVKVRMTAVLQVIIKSMNVRELAVFLSGR